MPASLLLVDDDPDTLDLVTFILQVNGYSVLVAAGAGEALKAAANYEGPVPLLVTDIRMPEVNGLELARRFRLEHPETKVVWMTAYADQFDLRGLPVVRKPFTPEELLAKVHEVLSSDGSLKMAA